MKLLFSFLTLFILSEAQSFFSWKIPLAVLSPLLFWESSGKFRGTGRDEKGTEGQNVIGNSKVGTPAKNEVDHDREKREQQGVDAYHRLLSPWELMENSIFMEVDKMPVLEINHPLFFHSFNNLTTRSPFSRL
jgi:hypothetical protein